MNPQEHYETHLAAFYSWMTGDFESGVTAFSEILDKWNLSSEKPATALDLGAGHGIQAISLSQAGFQVEAVDSSKDLLEELKMNAAELDIRTHLGDIRQLGELGLPRAELILCWGDTLTHLANMREVAAFLARALRQLKPNGKLGLGFRDYSQALRGNQRFIPVRSDEERIHTCFLEYEEERVLVTDLLHEKTADGWSQKASTYPKVRIAPEEVIRLIESVGGQLILREMDRGMVQLLIQNRLEQVSENPFPLAAFDHLATHTLAGIKVGTERPNFLDIWMVQIGNRIFARSWSRKPNGWFASLIHEGRGEVQFGETVYPIRSKQVPPESPIHEAIDVAYLRKYHQSHNQAYAEGITQASYREVTVEFLFDPNISLG